MSINLQENVTQENVAGEDMRLSKCVAVTAVLLAGAMSVIPATAQNSCASARDLRLINGEIHTMDSQNRIVHEVTLEEGRFAYVGPIGKHPLNPCTTVIDLHGHTVVPGLIDNHNHIVLLGSRPGHDIELEGTTTIPQALALLKHRSQTIPSGAWVTTIGDWLPKQFAEKRNPTLAELDQAVPNDPVLIVPSFGLAITNSLGKTFFEGKGIAVSPAGVIGAGDPTNAAIGALREMQTLADKIQGAQYAQSYMLRFGATTSVDMGFFAIPGSPDMQDSDTAAGIASLNPWTAYDPIAAMDREGKLNERLRLFIITQDKLDSLPVLRERLENTFPDFGDEMLRVSGIGEFASPWFGLDWAKGQRPDSYEAALQLVAKHGWTFQQHSLSLAEDKFAADTFEKVNAVTPIAPLHWSVAHVPSIDRETVDRLKAVGAGVAVHGFPYLLGKLDPQSTGGAGPPYRMILESGIHAGAGSDAGDFAVLDPWLDLYYMVTGKDVTGTLINQGQTLTRQEALHLYTADNSWFFPGGDQLGSIEPGKLGDLSVLSADYFDPAKVDDEAIKKVESVLTVVGGKVVYGSAELSVGQAQ
jgi:predicted amidohydrolase YtcJ